LWLGPGSSIVERREERVRGDCEGMGGYHGWATVICNSCPFLCLFTLSLFTKTDQKRRISKFKRKIFIIINNGLPLLLLPISWILG